MNLTHGKTTSITRTLAVLAGSLFSPTLPLLKFLLTPYLDWNLLLNGVQTPEQLPRLMLMLIYHLQTLGLPVLMFHIMPIVLGCTLLSFLFLMLCARAGDLLAHWLMQQLKRRTSTS